MKVLIIEDELPAAKRLISILRAYDPEMYIVGILDSNKAIRNWVAINEQPDLIFSDIELLDGQVFDVLSTSTLKAPIIFTTAYQQYALNAFETNGISYLLKPFDLDQVNKAMGKYKSLKATDTEEALALLEKLKLTLNTQVRPFKTKLSVKLGTGIYLLEVSEIAFIATANGLPYAHKANGQKMALSSLVSELEQDLDECTFFRINRGELINANFIGKIEPYFNDRLALTMRGADEKLIVAASKTPAFRKWLNKI
ncbi:MAG: response regulator transcription factor [Roseivirga sp.]|nr:response regulator transcription factor [Roseivirga sp.]